MRILLQILLFLCSFQLFAQSYSFRNYNVEDGVSHPFIYDIEQDSKGYLWLATGEGLSKFDGFHFKNYFTNHGLSENFVSTLHQDAQGNLWMGHKQGGCTIHKDNAFKTLNTSQYFNSTIRAIREDHMGNTWLLSQHSGMIRVNPFMEIEAYTSPFSQLLLYDLQITEKGQMLVGTNEGLYLYLIKGQNKEPEFEKIVMDIPLTKINCIVPGKLPGLYYVGTEDEGVYKIQVRNNHRVAVTEIGSRLNLDQFNVQTILEESDNSLWIGSFGKGLIHLTHLQHEDDYSVVSRFNETNGLGSNDIKTIFRDREDNIWAGKFGGNHNAGGISCLSNNSFVFYTSPLNDEGTFYSVHGRGNSYWMGLKNAVMSIDSGIFNAPKIYSAEHGLPNDIFSSIYVDEAYNVWAGSDQKGLYFKSYRDSVFQPFELSKDRLSLSINDITGNDENTWVATKNGIYEIDQQGDIIYYNKENGLEHNVVKSLYLDDKNNLWYSTASAYLSYIKQGKIVNIVISEDQRVHDQVGITKDNNGNIWLATNGSGIFIFDYESIKTINAQSHGLKSNFCYSIAVDEHNKVWIGHKGGLSCYNPSSDQIQIIDQNEGMMLDFQPNASFTDQHGEIWMGTNKKLVRYNPSKDMHNSIAPIINIETVSIEDEIMTGDTLDLPYGQYKAKFKFLGLSFKKASKVTYQYMLEGHDREWQEVTSNTEAYYSRIDPGHYTFKVVAFNSDGIKSPVPADVSIFIEKPIWQKTWFIVLSVAAVIILLVSLIKLRDRRQKRIRQYLKKNLDIRTKEVRAKSRELEKKNKDITSSIHYAKKIQDATLPDQWKLQKHFEQSFIFYQPRDIISGDFYWFAVKNNKLIICVADCTGHGVPGALLSMIGSTKLDHIVSQTEETEPDKIMRQLDEELRIVLQQTNTSGSSPQDGMDMVVAEIDLDTHWVRICNAMSNVYVASEGGVEKISGDRNSIGGNHLGHKKEFTLHQRQMKHGEALYLTSDGYQDQFGGDKGKKLKRSGIIELLGHLRNHPAVEQHKMVEKHFTEWKHNLEQIDDVLLVGFRF